MRPINFRGQDKANKKWVYGNLEIPLMTQSISRHYIIGWAYGQYQKHEVYPETVGQYTGLKDKSGKAIYEGDIIRTRYSEVDEWETYEVKWMNDYPAFDLAKFYHDIDCNSLQFILIEHEFAEVIGNIYENPDLLEAK